MRAEPAPGSAAAAVARFESALALAAPYMLPSLQRQRDTFGSDWELRFGETLARFVAHTDAALHDAVQGYVAFAVDGMRLQRRFERTGVYESARYQEVAQAVYHNDDHMLGTYLPGLLLSHFLWPHHYRQIEFLERTFLPRFAAARDRAFCDVGPGTGFYSRQLLTAAPDARGWAFDISRASLEFSRRHIDAFGAGSRWTAEQRDILANPPSCRWPFLVCLEVLEHLEDPVGFLRGLRAMLVPGGAALLSAAVTAANEDHIYLYRSGADVRAHIEAAGFTVIAAHEDRAYEPKAVEPVPINACFVAVA